MLAVGLGSSILGVSAISCTNICKGHAFTLWTRAEENKSNIITDCNWPFPFCLLIYSEEFIKIEPTSFRSKEIDLLSFNTFNTGCLRNKEATKTGRQQTLNIVNMNSCQKKWVCLATLRITAEFPLFPQSQNHNQPQIGTTFEGCGRTE